MKMKGLFIILIFLLITTIFTKTNEVIILGKNQIVELIEPIKVKEGPDGNIYVFDLKDYNIKVYSAYISFI